MKNFLNNDVIFLNIAKEISAMSNCVSHKVGAILVKDKRIISTGYNGTPAGFKNCNEVFDKDFDRERHHHFSELYEIHAEMNAILFAAKNDISINEASIYCTLHPCNQCLKNLCNCSIKNIFYEDDYDKFEDRPVESLLLRCSKIYSNISYEKWFDIIKSENSYKGYDPAIYWQPNYKDMKYLMNVLQTLEDTNSPLLNNVKTDRHY